MSTLVRFDWAVKYLLRDKANFDILEGFLSAVIGEDIQVQELLESEANQVGEKDKFNRVDLLVKDRKGELFFIEVQVEPEQDFFQRMIYGTSKLIAQYMKIGKPYRDIKKVISVSITYFDLGEGKDYVYHGSTNFIGMNQKDKLELTKTQQNLFGKSDVYGLFPEYYLLRVEAFDDHVNIPLDEWVYMLKHDEVEPNFNAKHIQDAGERLRYMSLNKKKKLEYDRYLENLSYRASMEESFIIAAEERIEQGRQEGIEQGKQEGIEQGRQEGIEQGKQEGIEQGKQEGIEQGRQEGIEQGRQEEKKNSVITIARNALAAGFSVSQIVEITGLSEADISQL